MHARLVSNYLKFSDFPPLKLSVIVLVAFTVLPISTKEKEVRIFYLERFIFNSGNNVNMKKSLSVNAKFKMA